MLKVIILLKLFILSQFALGQTREQINQILDSYDSNKARTLTVELQEDYNAAQERINNFLERHPTEKRQKIDAEGNYMVLRDISADGIPLYVENHNDGASKTIRADRLYNGGTLGLNVQGQNMTAGVWEVGSVARSTHRDLSGRITVIDGTPQGAGGIQTLQHATHVTGTVISSGESSPVNLGRGIAFEANVVAGNQVNDYAEMNTQASTNGLLVSNHSYGLLAGNLPIWFFGAYTGDAAQLDLVCSQNPFYLPVFSAGNDRNSGLNPTKGGYDLLTGDKNAKNNMVVGAVNVVVNYTEPSSVVIASFSSYGPTDDGRIKPDIVSRGTGVLSTIYSSDTAYGSLSGTSMASPGITGLVTLLQQHYNNINSNFMRSATVKGLILHTADEAGTAQGPDYSFGWGLANGEDAAQLISNNGTSTYISENDLTNGNTYTEEITAFGNEPLEVSISWTDPFGTAVNNVEDDRTPVLVNDLDAKLESMGTDYFPWKLDAINYTAAATRNSTNDVDNFEKIEVDSPNANQLFNLTINHKESLQGGNQNYTLIISGGVPSSLLSVSDFSNGSKEVIVTPNPAQDFVNILLKNGVDSLKKVRVFDSSGKMLLLSNSNNVDIRRIPPGVYFVEIETQSKVYREKFVKK